MNKKILIINITTLLLSLLFVNWFTSIKVEHGDYNAGLFHFILGLPIIFLVIIANWLCLYFFSTFLNKKKMLFLAFMMVPILSAIVTILPFGFDDEVVLNMNVTLVVINCLTFFYNKFIKNKQVV